MPSNTDAIRVEGLTKIYRTGVGRARIREMLPWPVDAAVRALFVRWWSRHTFNALEDVSLSVPVGSSVGVVGHNGAGKTTLLKVISGVTAPSGGKVCVSGRVAALLDVVIGFHPDLTGRENVYLLGAIHGFGRRAMGARIDRILDFAEIDELADTPLKRYSVGMIARLGFATVATLEINILLVDEILAVGDASFQRKSINWLDEYRSQGGTLVFVSHNLSLLRSMTDRVVWLDHGMVRDDGPTASILAHYAKAMERRDAGPPLHRPLYARRLMMERGLYRWGAGGARVEEVHIGEPSDEGRGMEITISYEVSELDRAIFCVGFVDEAEREIGGTASPSLPLKNGRGSVLCRFRPFPLRAGIYFPVIQIVSPDGLVRDRWRLDRAIVVDHEGEERVTEDLGPVDLPAAWSSR